MTCNAITKQKIDKLTKNDIQYITQKTEARAAARNPL